METHLETHLSKCLSHSLTHSPSHPLSLSHIYPTILYNLIFSRRVEREMFKARAVRDLLP